MSLATWKAEFYPIEAMHVEKKDAVDHSLRKWEGMREENLKKHNVKVNYGDLQDIENDRDRLVISSSSCALCQHYSRTYACPKCPLYEVRGLVRCDHLTGTELLDSDSPWHTWVLNTEPLPMIDWLKKAKKWEEMKNAGR